MSCCLRAGFSVYGSNDAIVKNRAKLSCSKVWSPPETIEYKESISREFLSKSLEMSDQKLVSHSNFKSPVNAQPPSVYNIGRALKWWEKSIHPNMIEVQSAQELVDSLLIAGDRLVILDFYSPGCGGCRTLHPKICQMAEMNPNAMFLKINFEEHKAMCYALHVHVLPFFRFYRGAEGRVCSFSCTNVTIKKFKDSVAKHGSDRCSLGPAKGLDESEVSALASLGLLSKEFGANSADAEKLEELVLKEIAETNAGSVMGLKEGDAMVMA